MQKTVLSDYIPVAAIAETVSALNADPRVVKVYVVVAVMQVNGIHSFRVTTFCINGN